jgi:hypothetical protein
MKGELLMVTSKVIKESSIGLCYGDSYRQSVTGLQGP